MNIKTIVEKKVLKDLSKPQKEGWEGVVERKMVLLSALKEYIESLIPISSDKYDVSTPITGKLKADLTSLEQLMNTKQ